MATSKAYVLDETALKINGEAGADYAWSVEGLATNAGRVSAQIDLGSGARAGMYQWNAYCFWQASPTQYKTLDFYHASAPTILSSLIPGDIGASDAALGDVDQLKNLSRFGMIVAEEADTTKMSGSGVIWLPHRYVSLVTYNQGGASINATDSNFLFYLTPYSIQGQAT